MRKVYNKRAAISDRPLSHEDLNPKKSSRTTLGQSLSCLTTHLPFRKSGSLLHSGQAFAFCCSSNFLMALGIIVPVRSIEILISISPSFNVLVRLTTSISIISPTIFTRCLRTKYTKHSFKSFHNNLSSAFFKFTAKMGDIVGLILLSVPNFNYQKSNYIKL